ncbi:MAG TPA: flavodoxin [Candidatus Merdicola faecigallinarum]|uniref:Flavodoxin n=1 Tax=Candidatus Merdicola faecigallinarum TaxID=2840862 RepID=A0A9D1M250_9FIRM|nr:flavodoxin [Candidatus Merdicola faecigallinarum]
MSKKVIALIVVIVLLVIIGGAVYFLNQNSNESQNSNNQEGVAEPNNENNNTLVAEENNGENTETTGKTLVVYFSAQGHTEEVAHKIAENLGGDTFEIVPKEEYTSGDLDWTDNNSRVTKEYEDESLRNTELVSTTVDNWEEYDTVIIGYPIWWGIAAWPVDTFVKANDFNGKTVIPFCTSASSGLGQSGELLAEEANGGNWQEGQRFRSNPSDSDIKSWTDSLKN